MARRDRPSEAALEAWQGLLRTHLVLVARLDRDLLERHGIALAWYDVLVQLHASGGETTMGELAERLLISPSTCTRVVEKMAAAELVDRRTDDLDHRVRHARLTPAGRTLLRRAAKTHLAGIQRHFGAHLDDAEAALLAERFGAMRRSAAS